MAQSGPSSFLGNMVDRRRALNRGRAALLDGPGIAGARRNPPAVVPADRPNPQRQAVEEITASIDEREGDQAQPDLTTREGRLTAVTDMMDKTQRMKAANDMSQTQLAPTMETREGRMFELKRWMHVTMPASRIRYP